MKQYSLRNSFALIACVALMNGCATAPIEPGNDSIVVRAEQTTKIALDTFKLIKKTEYESYASLKQISPETAVEVRTYVNIIRAQSPDWLETARNVTKAYKKSRTQENASALTSAIAVLQSAIDESKKYISLMRTKTSAWNRLRYQTEIVFARLTISEPRPAFAQ